MSISTKLQNKEYAIEALRRAKAEFPGHQKIHISKRWGITKFNVDECEDMVAEKQLISDDCGPTEVCLGSQSAALHKLGWNAWLWGLTACLGHVNVLFALWLLLGVLNGEH
ncbi:hypothetical protein H8959_020864 [Pygathrix nigripes]